MNPMKTTVAALALGLFAGLSAASTRSLEPAAAPVKLAGTWTLNKELSDNPGQKMMEGMRGAGGPGGREGRPEGGGGGMGNPGGGGGGMGGRGGGGGGMGGRPGGGGGMGGPGGRGRGGGGFFGGEPPLDGTPGQDRPQGEDPQRQGGDPGAGGHPTGEAVDRAGRGDLSPRRSSRSNRKATTSPSEPRATCVSSIPTARNGRRRATRARPTWSRSS